MQLRSILSLALIACACKQTISRPYPIKRTDTETGGAAGSGAAGARGGGTTGDAGAEAGGGYSGDGPMSEPAPPNQSLPTDEAPDPPWSVEPSAGPSAEHPGDFGSSSSGASGGGRGGGGGGGEPATTYDPREGTKPGQFDSDGIFIPIPGCPEIVPATHEGHDHERPRRYKPFDVCEDERCIGGMRILACTKDALDEFLACNKAAITRRNMGRTSALPADRAEAARCQGKRSSYVPVRFWEQYFRDNEDCHDHYDVNFRTCVGDWEIRGRAPRPVRAGPLPTVPPHR